MTLLGRRISNGMLATKTLAKTLGANLVILSFGKLRWTFFDLLAQLRQRRLSIRKGAD